MAVRLQAAYYQRKIRKINLAKNELTIIDNQIQQFIKEQHITDELKKSKERNH